MAHILRLEQGSQKDEFLKTCKAVDLNSNILVECLIEIPMCHCVIYFGNGKYCQHPLKHDISKRTLEEKETRK